MNKYAELEREAFGDNKKYWEYRKKWVDNPKNHVVDNAPLNLDIELTSVCNLRCPMCARTIYMEKGLSGLTQGFMSFELYKKVIGEAASLGVHAVKLIWRGEPTLHKELPEFVKYAKDKGILDVLINTNALLLTEELSVKLIEAGLDKIIFSLDSANEETYKKIRVGSDFNTVVGNIGNLNRLKADMSIVKPLTFASMIKTELNNSEEEEFAAFFGEMVDNIYIANSTEQDKTQLETSKKIEGFSCEQIWQRLIIDWSGKVVPCCYDTEFYYTLGDISKDSIHDIWHGKKLSELRRLHAEGRYDEIEICKICAVASSIEF